MITYIPKNVFKKGIVVYFISLTIVSIVFSSYAMDLLFFVIGIPFILLFFLRAPQLNYSQASLPANIFKKKLFRTALLLRILWVIFSYFLFIVETGQPFEWSAADSQGYHMEAEWLASESWEKAFSFWFSFRSGVSDIGYPIYLTFVYNIIGPNIFITRIIKAILSAYTCVLVYKVSSRTFSEPIGRIASLFAAFMPNLIIYCGLHLKETEMLFLTMMFIERTDYLFRSHNFSFKTIIVPSLFAISLFFFRTVLGMTAFLSFFTAFILNTDMKTGKKFLTSLWIVAVLAVFVGGKAMTEVESVLDRGTDDQRLKREEQASRGAQWAKYATGTVMAPMMFIVPFSTMIDTNQPNQNLIHTGTYTKNFLGVFVLFALFYAIKLKKWRDFSLIGSFTITYLMILAFSGFANSERFHLPALPCILMMAAYGLSQLNRKNMKYVNYWCVIVVLMEFGWAFFKLGSRGIVSL